MLTRPRWVIAACLALGGLACNALFGETSQCATDDDCGGLGTNLMCGAEGTCVTREVGTGPSPTNDGGPGVVDTGVADAPPSGGGALASIIVSPPTATVATNGSQTFYAVGKDALGAAPAIAPVYTWSVNGGGSMDGGVFTAGPTAGGPFTVTCASGPISATATVTVSVAPPMDIKIGETNMLANDDSGNMDLVLAQEATLAQTATLKSLSFYITMAAGNLKLGVYDASGPNGGPGVKKAETAEFAAAVGFNAVPVMAQVSLAAGKYWLAYAPSDNNLHFALSDANDGKLAYFARTYDGTLPDTFDLAPTTDTKHWSFYATLTK